MPCEEASRREDGAYQVLSKAIAQRARIDASVAAYTDHWEAYEAAVNELTLAASEYQSAALALLDGRAEHLAGRVGSRST